MWSAGSIEITKHRVLLTSVTLLVQSLCGPVQVVQWCYYEHTTCLEPTESTEPASGLPETPLDHIGSTARPAAGEQLRRYWGPPDPEWFVCLCGSRTGEPRWSRGCSGGQEIGSVGSVGYRHVLCS